MSALYFKVREIADPVRKKRRKLTTKTTLTKKNNAHTHANQNRWNYSPTGKIEKCSGVTTTYVLMYTVVATV